VLGFERDQIVEDFFLTLGEGHCSPPVDACVLVILGTAG
jgi:hypothetical protein